jgi:hypothetical protein
VPALASVQQPADSPRAVPLALQAPSPPPRLLPEWFETSLRSPQPPAADAAKVFASGVSAPNR